MNIDNTQLPWQQNHWELLQQRRQQARLPHALLLSGPEGLGKQKFAARLAQSLLCLSPSEDYKVCVKCRGCQLIQAETHPDWINITPEKQGAAIKVDQVRELITFLNQTSQFGGDKIVLIHSADALNINAANALLKTLEEPSANSIIILLTNRLMLLPATVRSRCQIIHFQTPAKTVAEQWLISQGVQAEQVPLLLSLARGAPLKVLNYVAEDMLAFRKTIFTQWLQYNNGKLDLISLAAEWSKLDLDQLLLHWRSWITDIIRILYSKDPAYLINFDYAESLATIAERCNLVKLYQFYDEMNKISYWLAKKISLNTQLLIEKFLIDFVGVY